MNLLKFVMSWVMVEGGIKNQEKVVMPFMNRHLREAIYKIPYLSKRAFISYGFLKKV